MDQSPTPTTPGQRGHGRSFSFRSDKSTSSAGKPRIDDLTESPREKERRDSIWKNNSKANPNAAMVEAQPGEINILEKATIEPLRAIKHKDARGNVITDPDLSNPTRPRMERPLDTIRQFEKNIESGYKRKDQARPESYFDQNGSQYTSRRSSYYGGYGEGQSRRPPLGGYYAGRPESYMDNGGPARMRYEGRMQSDSAIPRQGWPQHGYPQQAQSHDAAGTSGTIGSDSTGPWTNSTDPSSENSSIERVSKAYAAHDTIVEEGAPQPPAHAQRRVIPLGDSAKRLPPAPQRPQPEKRQSWLKRTFSKKS